MRRERKKTLANKLLTVTLEHIFSVPLKHPVVTRATDFLSIFNYFKKNAGMLYILKDTRRKCVVFSPNKNPQALEQLEDR